MASHFLADDNACGKNLLQIVSNGNAIVAKIQHLAEMIPSVYRLSNKQDQSNFGDLIMSFDYFKSADSIEKRIENDPKLLAKDEELRETYLELLTKFYVLFESIERYSMELRRFIIDLDDGFFIQQSVETVLMDYDGKQLLCEALYLMGVILLILDRSIDGLIRERLMISYYRYSASRSIDSKIDDVFNLIHSTGYSLNSRRPTNYPCDYFKRARIPESFSRLIIGRLRFDDLYNLLVAYPKSEHRSVALSTQASMLFVALYFVPEILNNEMATMREIVDKFFYDNFVISIYMGTIVNLIEQWDPFKAARAALNNTIDSENVKNLVAKFSKEIESIDQKLSQLLKEGFVTEESVLNRSQEYMNHIRDANVTLRWTMLHTVTLNGDFSDYNSATKRIKQLRLLVQQEHKFNALRIFSLLLNCSEFEQKIKDHYREILRDRSRKLIQLRNKSVERIKELEECFAQSKPIARIEPNEALREWFEMFRKQIESINLEGFGAEQSNPFKTSTDYSAQSNEINSNSISRNLIQLIKALEEIQELDQLETNLQLKQNVIEVHHSLYSMVKLLGLKEKILITQQIVSDLSYAWRVIDTIFTKFMQDGIKNDPTMVTKLVSAFLKLASALDLPLLRINQSSSSSDLVLVSKFYSNELVLYVRKVLHIIPETMFNLMAKIIDTQTNRLKELPTRLMKDQLKQFAQLDERFEIAECTYKISIFTEGILAMKTTLIGVIQIDPKKLLEEGIRRELVRRVTDALHRSLIFSATNNSKTKTTEMESKLRELQTVMSGFRRSFEYIQDYVCINGLKMWQEEVARIFNYNVEQECNAFVRHKVLDYQSLFQSKLIPIPNYPPTDQYSNNFVGRLLRELIRITSYRTTIYVYGVSAWYEWKSRNEIIDSKLFQLILFNFGVSGTNGLDRLISFHIVSRLNEIFDRIDCDIHRNKSICECFQIINDYLISENPNGIITGDFIAYYLPLIQRLSKSLTKLADLISEIGQLQILRQNLVHEISMSSKFNARLLQTSLSILNETLMIELQKQSRASLPSSLETTEASEKENFAPNIFQDESPFLFELVNYLEFNGQSDPLMKIYVKNRLPSNLDVILLLVVIAVMPKFIYCKEINSLCSSSSAQKLNESIDGLPFVFGLLTVLRQFHSDLAQRFFRFGSLFVNSWIQSSSSSQRKVEIPIESINMLQLLNHCCMFGRYRRQLIVQFLPQTLVDQFQFLGLYSLCNK
ncbi:WASH complex subunit strumpellin-like protein [Sarcoptes scabiei]|uniref:WASH complex subunit strumpellin-like protein n=1 Tax=Sarcoptes scabiei TaxID=52283 RepID=A0A132A3H1_SARSC|nr:WASH complex subunit strumpellin-like protein [Sarcoptes scabiei]